MHQLPIARASISARWGAVSFTSLSLARLADLAGRWAAPSVPTAISGAAIASVAHHLNQIAMPRLALHRSDAVLPQPGARRNDRAVSPSIAGVIRPASAPR